jgi:hypothetical protein
MLHTNAKPMRIRTIIPVFVLSGAACAAAGPPQDSAVGDFLYAIRQVESGDRYDGPAGRGGELGAYQFRQQVWYHYTQEPFAEARTPYADDVALRHYHWIAKSLKTAGLWATPWNIAAAWNGGVAAVRSGRLCRATRDYATRVQNLVSSRAAARRALETQSGPALAMRN